MTHFKILSHTRLNTKYQNGDIIQINFNKISMDEIRIMESHDLMTPFSGNDNFNKINTIKQLSYFMEHDLTIQAKFISYSRIDDCAFFEIDQDSVRNTIISKIIS